METAGSLEFRYTGGKKDDPIFQYRPLSREPGTKAEETRAVFWKEGDGKA
jgi:hypothetical protein